MPVTMKTGAVNVKNLDTNLYENMDINISEDFAPINSPAFTGTPTAPTQAASDDSTKIATTAFVHDLVDPKDGGYGTCSTASGTTAKVVAMENYELVKGGQVVIKFTYAVPANATLNINSQGAKAIYFKESIMGSSTAIDGSTIRAGDICTFVYDGTHYVLTNIDRWGLPATTSRSGLMSADDKSKLNNLDSSDIMDNSDVGGPTVEDSLSSIKGSLNSEQTTRQNSDTALQSALAYVETNFQSASRTYAVGEYFFSTTYNRLYRVTVATPQGTSFENHVAWMSVGGFNDLATHSNQSVASGISGITTNILDGWLVRLAFYITSPVEVAAGDLTTIGNLPESLRPTINQSYLLVYGKANNAPATVGVRVAANGDLIIYNIGGSAITYQTIQGICYYPII